MKYALNVIILSFVVSISGCSSIVKEMGIDTSSIETFIMKRMQPAATEGNTKLMDLVLDDDIDSIKNGFASGDFNKTINDLNKAEMSALNLAAIFSTPEVVRYLIKKGANKKLKDVNGFTPALHAASTGKVENLKIIVGRKYPKDFIDGQSALHFSAHGGRVEVTKYLLSIASYNDVVKKDKWGQTPLEIAIKDTAPNELCNDIITKMGNGVKVVIDKSFKGSSGSTIERRITYFDMALMYGLYDVADTLERRGVKRTNESIIQYEGYVKAKRRAKQSGGSLGRSIQL